MPDQIDPTSSAIGRLQGEMEMAHRQTADLATQIGELRKDLNDGFRDVRDLLVPLRELPSTVDDQEARLAALEARSHKAAGVAVALGAFGTGAVGLLGWLGSKIAWSKFVGGS